MEHIIGNAAMRDTCLAMGAFDGMHCGHAAVLGKLLQFAAEKGLAPALLSLEGNGQDKRLMTAAEQRLLLEGSGLAAMVSVEAEMSAAELVRCAAERLGAKVIVAGENDSRLNELREGAGIYGYELVICPVVKQDGRAVTSQWAAEALAACDFPLLRLLLGYPYFIYGEVVYGKQLGRTVGQPTANISYPPEKLLPPDGVYGTVTMVAGVPTMGLVNIGKRPTVDTFDYVTVENFLLDFSGDLYGQFLKMDVHTHIRGVMKFNSLEELKRHVDRDLQAVRASLERYMREYAPREE